MHLNQQIVGRERTGARTRIGALLGLLMASVAFSGEAQAQELTHRFLNPSFGGNPFYSDHLLGIANIHRPDEPEDTGEEPPSEEELIASQIRARLLSGLSGDILDRIEAARPGESGNFEFGDQRISFTRSATETRVTFVNSRTGETRTVVIPVRPPSRFSSTGLGTRAASAEQALGAGGASPLGSISGLATGAGAGTLPSSSSNVSNLLGSRSLEVPLLPGN